jgi:hypothetical protein
MPRRRISAMHTQYDTSHDPRNSHDAAEPPAALQTPPEVARDDTVSAPHAAPRGGSILPGIAVAALIVGGIGIFAYADWRAAHPLADVPDDVEPVLKVPGVVPRALRR